MHHEATFNSIPLISEFIILEHLSVVKFHGFEDSINISDDELWYLFRYICPPMGAFNLWRDPVFA